MKIVVSQNSVTQFKIYILSKTGSFATIVANFREKRLFCYFLYDKPFFSGNLFFQMCCVNIIRDISFLIS